MHRTFRQLALVVGGILVLAAAPSMAFQQSVIDEVLTSYNGDTGVQFVEIRMLAAGQDDITNTVLGAFDGSGTYIGDLLVVDSDVANDSIGTRWLIGTPGFAAAFGMMPDFFINADLPVGGGMICWGAPGVTPPAPASWDHTDPTQYVDCVAYGLYGGPSNAKIGTPTSKTADHHSLQRGTNTNNNTADFSCAVSITPENNAGTSNMLGATALCSSAPASQYDAVINRRAPLNITIPPGMPSAIKPLKVAVRNVTATAQTIGLDYFSDCPAGVALSSPDFVASTPAADTSILIPPNATKTAKVTVTVTSSMVTSFSIKAPTRCTVFFFAREATQPLPDGAFDPRLSNNRLPVEINIVDKNDPDTSGQPESFVKSITPKLINIPDLAATKVSSASVVAGNGDRSEVAGHSISLALQTSTCPLGALSEADFIPKTPSADSVSLIKGGATKGGKVTITATSAKVLSPDKNSPARCIATYAAFGPSEPETAPRDPSNSSTQFVVDMVDKNDF